MTALLIVIAIAVGGLCGYAFGFWGAIPACGLAFLVSYALGTK